MFGGSRTAAAGDREDQYFDDEVYFPSPGHRNTFGHHNVGDENSHRFYFKLRFSTPPRNDDDGDTLSPLQKYPAEMLRPKQSNPPRSRSESPQDGSRLAPALPQPPHVSAADLEEHVPQPSPVFQYEKLSRITLQTSDDDVVSEGIATVQAAQAHHPPRAPPHLTPMRAEFHLEVAATPPPRALPWIPIAELPAAAVAESRRPFDHPTRPSDTIRDPQQHPQTLLPLDRREAIFERVYPSASPSASLPEAEARAQIKEEYPPELMLWRARAGYPYSSAHSPCFPRDDTPPREPHQPTPTPGYDHRAPTAQSPIAAAPQKFQDDASFLNERSALMHSLLESPASNRTLRLHEQYLRRVPGRRTLEGHALGLAAADEARRAAYAKVKLEEATNELLRAEPKGRREIQTDETQAFSRIRLAFSTELTQLIAAALEDALNCGRNQLEANERIARLTLIDEFSDGRERIEILLRHRADRLRGEAAEAAAREVADADESAARAQLRVAAAAGWLAAATSRIVRESDDGLSGIISSEVKDRAAMRVSFEMRNAQLALQHAETTLRARIGVTQESDFGLIMLNEEQERLEILRKLEVARLTAKMLELHHNQRVELTETRLSAAMQLLEAERDAALADLAERELRDRHTVQRGDLERAEAAVRSLHVAGIEAEQWAALLEAEAVERDDARDRENARLNKIHRHISVSHAMQRTTLVAREGQARVDMCITVETAARERLLKTFEDELTELKRQTLLREQRKARTELAVVEEQLRVAAVEVAEVEDLRTIESLMALSGQRVIFSGGETVARKAVLEAERTAWQSLLDEARRHKDDAIARQRQREAREAEEAAVRELCARAQKSRPFIGMSLAEKVVDPKTRQSMAKLTAENLLQPRLVVDSLYVDGPAYREGLRLGDVIVSVGGVRSSSLDAVRASILKNAIVGGKISIVVRRRVVTTSSPQASSTNDGAATGAAASPSAASTATTNSAGTGEAMDAENSMRGNPLHFALDDDQIETSSVASGESAQSAAASIAQETELFVPVLTIDPQFAALRNWYFDIKAHEKIEREPQAGSGLVIKRTKSSINVDDGGSSATLKTPARSAASSAKGSPPSSLGSTATLDSRRLAKTVALLDGVDVSSNSTTFTSTPGSGGEATMAATIPRLSGAATSGSLLAAAAGGGPVAGLLGVPELATSGRRPSSSTSGATLATTPGRVVGGPRSALSGASPPATTAPKKMPTAASAVTSASAASAAKRPSTLVRK